MKTLCLFSLSAFLLFSLGFLASCSCNDDDDDSGGDDEVDDDSGDDDDDSVDDDDITGDDDTGDDDTGDDDTGDDDTGDDDTGDDDTGDDDTGDDDVDDDSSGDTWTDSTSGLTWQVTPSSNVMVWDDANPYCENLTLAGGGWHLPTISELRTLIRGCEGTVTGGTCGATDDCLSSSCLNASCYSCAGGAGPNNGCYGPSELPGECNWYWSSSLVEDAAPNAWFVGFDDGRVDYDYPIYTNYFARCVR